jgi:LuxR family maltose regulon positive regulatory protein
MGLDLSGEEVAALEARTEGWIAGLQIAALSMQDREDISGFIQAFSGSHRHILGYLAEEVLNQQPGDTLDFLLQTSILERLCGPLCEAVTGNTDGQAMLESLEHVNLFITPLDDEGIWYRYHHLFAEVLQARLQQSQPESLTGLHARASEWYEAHGSVAEAIQHALASGNALRAANLVEREKWGLLGRGEVNTLHRWLDELPVEIVSDNPGLSLAYSWIYTILRQTEAIESRLQDAEKALDVQALLTSDRPAQIGDAIRGEIATLRAEIALGQSDIPRAIALCRDALKLLPEDNPLMRGFATYFLGHGERGRGHMAEAEQAYLEASLLGLQADNLLIALHALVNLSNVQRAMGRLGEAARTCQRILQILAERQRQAWPVAGLAYYGLGKLYYEWNDLSTAVQYARQAIESGQRGGLTGLEFDSQNVLAFALQALHDPSGADRVLRSLAVKIEQTHHPVHTAYATAREAHLRLIQGRIEQAIHWSKNCDVSSEDAMLPYSREIEYLTLARVLIAQGQTEDAWQLLARLLQAAESVQRTGSLIEILILQALVCQLQNNFPGALDALEHALILAEPEGYVRSFVDEGEPMRLLLVEYRSSINQQDKYGIDNQSIRLLAYTGKLLAAFSRPVPAEQPESEATLEPLSERELDILRLIAGGYTNQEIAEILMIAVSTVKSHINHLYGKLGIQRRTQAVAVARDLGLLID